MTAKEIEDALCEATASVEAANDVDVPDRLIPVEQLEELMKCNPTFVGVDDQVHGAPL